MDTKHLRRYQYWRSCERINIDEVANDYDEKNMNYKGEKKTLDAKIRSDVSRLQISDYLKQMSSC